MVVGNRRRFLGTMIGSGAALGMGATAWHAIAPRDSDTVRNNSPEAGWPRVTRTARAFGTEVSITTLHAQQETAEQAVAAAFAELESVEEVMSLYRPHSQVCRLNREGALDNPHPYLVEVLMHALALSEKSDGAFDVTVQPLWELFAAAKKAERLPTDSEIVAVRSTVDWRRLDVSNQRIRLNGGDMAITLNGIAQGFAADRAEAALLRHGIEDALVNTGEIGTLGTKADAEPWTVGIQHPRQADAFLSLAKLSGRSLATSGDYATSFSPDHRHHHIFNPRTGRSPEEFSSVSIVAATGLEADALSTAVFVLGLERGLELIHRTPAADALFVLKDGRTQHTAGFPLESPV